MMVVNNALIRPYFLGGGIGGWPLDFHDMCSIIFKPFVSLSACQGIEFIESWTKHRRLGLQKKSHQKLEPETP